jgi:hypothetical protein
VVQEHEPLDRRIALVDLGGQLREREAGHDVRDDRPARAERVGDHRGRLVARLVRHDERDVGVRVIDEPVRKKRVQQRLDRRIRRTRLEETRAQLIHHLLVGERGQGAQPPEVREIDRRQAGRLDRIKVPPASLDEERLDAVADERRDVALERRVAAPVHDEIGIAPDQA